MTTVINLIAGPGAGKSTAAAAIFAWLKQQGYTAELVTEYAKDVTWEETQSLLTNQLHILSEQYRRQKRLDGKVQYVVTDSPLILSNIYLNLSRKPYLGRLADSLCVLAQAAYDSFDNQLFYVYRNKPYVTIGRNQTEEEAKTIDTMISDYLMAYKIPFIPTNSNEAVDRVIKWVTDRGVKQ